MERIIETQRLYLRKITENDYNNLCLILKDAETMYAYEGAFSDNEVNEWLTKQLKRYDQFGFGLWAVILKEKDVFIGQCGLTMQQWKDKSVLEIGYLFRKEYWHRGYATEAASACRDYAFNMLNADEVCSIIRDSNIASQNVAKRVGMTKTDEWVKNYRGVNMPHLKFTLKKSGCENK